MHSVPATALLAALCGTASAHMMLSYPAPFRSKLNQFANQATIDYSYTSPLNADGSNYPCKGYQADVGTPAGKPTAEFKIGAQSNVTVVGGAAHGGGSCQISLSTDGAKTFTVIQSIIGNCPVETEGNLDFTIPDDAPAGDAILAWSWNNRIGNREMYMNCAAVTLTGGSSPGPSADKSAVAFSSRPHIFVANINDCHVAEGGDVSYPDPGPDVKNQTDKPLTPTGNCNASSGSSGSGAGAGTGPGPSASVPPPAAPPASTPTNPSSSGGESAPVPSEKPRPTTMVTSTVTYQPSQVPESPVGAGANAPGTPCSNEGQFNCIDGTSFQQCASGMWSTIGSVAPGTKCSSVGVVGMNIIDDDLASSSSSSTTATTSGGAVLRARLRRRRSHQQHVHFHGML